VSNDAGPRPNAADDVVGASAAYTDTEAHMDLALTPAQADVRRQVSALARSVGWEYWRRRTGGARPPEVLL